MVGPLHCTRDEPPVVRFDVIVKVDLEYLLTWKPEQIEAFMCGVAAIINAGSEVSP